MKLRAAVARPESKTLADKLQESLTSWVSSQARVLCAISGGPDSVVLAQLLKGLPYDVVLGHVDHQIRKNSHQDARFVRMLAERWELPYRGTRVAVPAHAVAHRLGLEEAARDLRYRALTEIALKSRCSVILTAHTADDQAETVLMNFLRGAGPDGLAGIPPVRELSPNLRLVRPLLKVTREEIMTYIRDHRLPFRRDPSNRSLRFTRNRIRHSVLPLLEKDYPGLRRRLTQMADIFREEQALWLRDLMPELNKTARQFNKIITVDLTRLLGYHRALGRRILRQLLTGISFQDVERVFQLALCPDGNLPVHLSGGLQVERKGNELIIRKRGFNE